MYIFKVINLSKIDDSPSNLFHVNIKSTSFIMVHRKIGLTSLVASTGVIAQNTTTASVASVFLPNADQFAYGVMGSIVAAQRDKTAIVLACPPKSNTDFCQYMIGDTVTYGPTTFSYNALPYTSSFLSSENYTPL